MVCLAPLQAMLLKPIKYPAEAVNPPPQIKDLANSLFDRVHSEYRSNYAKFKAETAPHVNNVINDPWYAREAWRWDPYFSAKNVIRRVAPGLGIASVAFAAFLVYDFMQPVQENGH